MRNANAQWWEIQRWDYENIINNKLYLTTINKDEVDAAGNCFLIVNYKVGRALTSMFYLHEWPLSSFSPCFSLLPLLTSLLLNILPANMSTTSNATNNQRVFISLVGDGACWYYWFWFWHQNNFDRKRFYFGKYFLNKECHWWGVNYCPGKMCGDSVKTEAGY